ncbi:hypothetical protein [Streptomyces chryseus]
MTFAPRTWVVGETVTAAMLNAEIRDQLTSMFDAWTSFTPTWTGVTTNPVLGNGTLVGRQLKIGRTCKVQYTLTVGSATTFGADELRFSLPFTAANISGGQPGVLNWTYARSGTPNFAMGASPLSNAGTTTGFIWLANPGTIGDWNVWSSGSPWVGAAGDVLRGYGEYQTAT